MDTELLSALAAILGGAGPATAAPVAPRVASPFTASAAARADDRPAEIVAAIAAYPGDKGSQRRTIATLALPRWSCDVDTTATLADGKDVPSALHGFTTAHTTGEPCPGQYGIPKGGTCPGKIR